MNATRSPRYIDVIAAFFAVALVVSGVVATKIINFGSVGPLNIVADGGAVMFPLTYILGDVLTEVYGYRYARRVIWLGFSALLFSTAIFAIVGALPADPSYTNQAAYEAVLGMVPIIVVASLTAFLFGEFTNSYVLAKLKVYMRGRHMWVRLIGSTIVGEFFDTAIFCGIVAIGFGMTFADFFGYFLVGWIFKTLVEVIMLPVTYRVIAFLKAEEGLDAYDTNTHFTPLSISLTS